jgi:branched-chain amino acid transport system permease protein
MKLKELWRENQMLIVLIVLVIVLTILGLSGMGTQSFVRTALSGLTLGSLFFMVAAGLTLIFGLMDVLNFAHGSMFMLGAYMGWQFYTNPTFLFGIAPMIAAFIAGISLLSVLQPLVVGWEVSEKWQNQLPRLLTVGAVVLGFIAVRGVDFLGLADTAMVSIAVTATDPLAEISAQEALSQFWLRPFLLMAAGALMALASARPGDKTRSVDKSASKRGWVGFGLLVVLTIVLSLVRESGPVAVLMMNGDLRFFLALLVGTASGFGLGVAVERVLVRTLYVRPFFIVLMTLGLSFVIREMVQLLWDPLAYQMSRPPAFSQPGKAENLLAWFSGNNSTVDIIGVTFPSYRIFIILLGIIMFIGLILLMQRTRIGMIIRAGVQDREMVEALGINVQAVFLLVFALGTAMAALGGIGAAPFIPVSPNMGDAYQMQGFITVVIGGMGSYVGAFIGAMLLGMARAFGDYFALKLSLSPAIAEASTVIIMVIVLLVRPAGLFGKKE